MRVRLNVCAYTCRHTRAGFSRGRLFSYLTISRAAIHPTRSAADVFVVLVLFSVVLIVLTRTRCSGKEQVGGGDIFSCYAEKLRTILPL